MSLEPRAPATWNLRLCHILCCTSMSAGNTSAMPSSDGLGEARRDNAMASRVSFAAAKEQDERDERDDEGGGSPIPHAVRRDDNLTRCRYPSRLGSQGGHFHYGIEQSLLAPVRSKTVEETRCCRCLVLCTGTSSSSGNASAYVRSQGTRTRITLENGAWSMSPS